MMVICMIHCSFQSATRYVFDTMEISRGVPVDALPHSIAESPDFKPEAALLVSFTGNAK